MDWMITFLGTIVGSIFFGIIGNLLTDPVKNWISKRSLINKRKRVSELKSELQKITSDYENKESFYMEVMMDSIVAILFLTIGIAAGIVGTALVAFANIKPTIFTIMNLYYVPLENESLYHQGLAVFFGLVGYGLMAVGFSIALTLYRKLRKVKNFTEYRVEIEKRILELSIKDHTAKTQAP